MRRGILQPLQSVPTSPSQLAWQPSVNLKSLQTSGAQLCRPRQLLLSMERGGHTWGDRMIETNLINEFVFSELPALLLSLTTWSSKSRNSPLALTGFPKNWVSKDIMLTDLDSLCYYYIHIIIIFIEIKYMQTSCSY